MDKRRGMVKSMFPNGQEKKEGFESMFPNVRQKKRECGGDGG